MKTKVYKKSDDIVTREVNGEFVIVPLSDSVADMTAVFTLKDVGAFIWELIDGVRNSNEIVSLITENYNIDSQTALNDFENFISELGNLVTSE